MITKNDLKWFNSAKVISKLSDFKKVKLGCIIIYKNAIISTGYNNNKSHPVQKRYNSYRFSEDGNHKIHAETMALLHIRALNINWRKIKIYIYREFKNGKPALARPCSSCMAMIKDLGIKNIYYTTNYGYSHEFIN